MSDSSESEEVEIKTTNKALPSHFGIVNIAPKQYINKQVPDPKPQPKLGDYNNPIPKKTEIFDVKIEEISKTAKNQNKLEVPPREITSVKNQIDFAKNPSFNNVLPGGVPLKIQNSSKNVENSSQNCDISGLPGQEKFKNPQIIQIPVPTNNNVFPQGSAIPQKNLDNTRPNPQAYPIPNQFQPQFPSPNTQKMKTPVLNPLSPQQIFPQQPIAHEIIPTFPNQVSNSPIASPKPGELFQVVNPQLAPKASDPSSNQYRPMHINKITDPNFASSQSNISGPQSKLNILPQASPLQFEHKNPDPPLLNIQKVPVDNFIPQYPPKLTTDLPPEVKQKASPPVLPPFLSKPSQHPQEFNNQIPPSGPSNTKNKPDEGLIQKQFPGNSKLPTPPKLGGIQPPSLLPNPQKIIENPFLQNPPPKLTEDQPFQRIGPLIKFPQNNVVPKFPGVAMTTNSRIHNTNLKTNSLGNAAAQEINIPRNNNFDKVIKKYPSERLIEGLQDLIKKLQPLIDINKILSNKQPFLQGLEKLYKQGCLEVKSYIDQIESLKCEKCKKNNIRIQLACKHNLCDDCINQLILKPSTKNPKHFIAFCPICNFEIPENQLSSIIDILDMETILYKQNEQRKKILTENTKLNCIQCKKDKIYYFDSACYHLCIDCVADRIRLRYFDCPECGEMYKNIIEIAETQVNCNKCKKMQYFVGDFMKSIHGGECTLCSECLCNTNNSGLCENCNKRIFRSEKIEINHFLFSGCEICQEDSYVGNMRITKCCRRLRCQKCSAEQLDCKKCGTAVEYF